MLVALRLASKGRGKTSPNPMVGAVLVRGGKVIGRGWHRQAGGPHAEIDAIDDARRHGHSVKGATLYVTLEPCSTHGRTPPCTEAIVAAGISRMVIGTVDPNPRHAGRGLRILKRAGLTVELACEVEEEAEAVQRGGRIAGECIKLNEAFNHWIVHRTPFVTVKAAMTLDGKIATATGESKWITGERARAEGMKMRKKSDAILVGVNTVLADDPSLTVRPVKNSRLRRIILDSRARTPLKSRLVSDEFAHLTTIVVGKHAPENRVKALARRIRVLRAPVRKTGIDLKWLLKRLGREQVTHLLVEGGGEVNTSFLMNGMAHRVCFFYAPKIVGGGDSHRAVAGAGARELKDFRRLKDLKWRRLGEDLMLTARVV